MNPVKLTLENLEDRSVPSATNALAGENLHQQSLRQAVAQTDDGPTATLSQSSTRNLLNTGTVSNSLNRILIISEPEIIEDVNTPPVQAPQTGTPSNSTNSSLAAMLANLGHANGNASTGTGGLHATGYGGNNGGTRGVLASYGGSTGGSAYPNTGNGSTGGGGSYVNGFGASSALNSAYNAGAGAANTASAAAEELVVIDPETKAVMRFPAAGVGGSVALDIDAEAGKATPMVSQVSDPLEQPTNEKADETTALDEAIQAQPAEFMRLSTDQTVEIVDRYGEPMISVTEDGVLINPRLMPLLMNGDLGDAELDMLLRPQNNMPDVPDWLRAILRESQQETPPTLEKSSAIPVANDGQVVIAAASPVQSPTAVTASQAQATTPQLDDVQTTSGVASTSQPLTTSTTVFDPRHVAQLQQGSVVVEELPVTGEEANLPGEQVVQLVREQEEPLLNNNWAFFMLLGTGAALATSGRLHPGNAAEERRYRRVRSI